MATYSTNNFDRNFDDVKELFEERIYGSIKGQYRLDMVLEDVDNVLTTEYMKLVDIGGGLGQVSLAYARKGWSVDYYDISSEMKIHLERQWDNHLKNIKKEHDTGSPGKLTTHLGGIRDAIELFQSLKGRKDYLLVTIHAVIEWLRSPLEDLADLLTTLPTNTLLSLLYHNSIPSAKSKKRDKPMRPNKLTPYHEFDAQTIEKLLQSKGFVIKRCTGIRVRKFARHGSHDELLEYLRQEREIARVEPYCRQGRYNHIVCVKEVEV